MSIVSFTATQQSRDLTTLNDVKGDLRLTGSSDDTLLERMIDRASRRLASAVNRELRQGTVVESLPPADSSRLWLRVTPVKSVTSITEDGETLEADSDNGYRLEDKEAGSIFSLRRWTRQLPGLRAISDTRAPEYGEEVYVVTYVGGYWLPGWTGSPGSGDVLLPADLEDAAIELVRMLYFRSQRDPSITAERLGDFSASYGSDAIEHGIPKTVWSEIAHYRRLVQA